MSERGTTALLALGALLLFFVLMFGGRAGSDVGETPRPSSVEPSANGHALARRWLESQGVRVLSLREPFGALARLAPPGAGRSSLLVLTLPGTGPVQTSELVPLDRWLRAGNTLLVLAALADAPDWSRGTAGADAFDLKAVTGLEFELLEGRAGRAVPAREPGVLLPAPRRESARAVPGVPLLEGVATLAGESDYERSTWAVRLPYDGIVLELARDAASGAGVLWSRPIGRGRIVVSGYGTLLTNRAIGRGDNGRLLANLVAASVGPEGAVLFDDGHQGLAPTYDPVQLFGDRRLHVTFGTLLALWLLWVLGATRLRTPRFAEPAPRPGELLRAAGGFFSRVLPPAAAAARLCEHFFAQLPSGRGSRHGRDAAPPWEWLARQPGIDPSDLRQLRDWHAAAARGRPVPLGKLHNLLRRMQQGLA
ncbi:MAG: hypothetical protein MUF07_16825 [Steroidobacteraceae bacterium]|jgi:hypothetical protein|nr:hypothetical protein [Steroidobacteraceae bacterium]